MNGQIEKTCDHCGHLQCWNGTGWQHVSKDAEDQCPFVQAAREALRKDS